MKNQPQFDAKAFEAFLEDMKFKFESIKKTLEKYPPDAFPDHEPKYIRNKQDMIEKMPFVEKTLQLALENQELVPKELIDRLWDSYDRYLTFRNLAETFEKMQERLLEICPEAAGEHQRTQGTTTS
jgi:Zn-dependent M32 family carboxypeptidase